MASSGELELQKGEQWRVGWGSSCSEDLPRGTGPSPLRAHSHPATPHVLAANLGFLSSTHLPIRTPPRLSVPDPPPGPRIQGSHHCKEPPVQIRQGNHLSSCEESTIWLKPGPCHWRWVWGRPYVVENRLNPYLDLFSLC